MEGAFILARLAWRVPSVRLLFYYYRLRYYFRSNKSTCLQFLMSYYFTNQLSLCLALILHCPPTTTLTHTPSLSLSLHGSSLLLQAGTVTSQLALPQRWNSFHSLAPGLTGLRRSCDQVGPFVCTAPLSFPALCAPGRGRQTDRKPSLIFRTHEALWKL